MNKKTRVIIRPDYVEGFRCVASACPENCCTGWTIHVDRKSYDAYASLPDRDYRSTLLNRVRVQVPRTGDIEYAKIISLPNGRCPFLSESGLCSMQEKLGADYLPDICRHFPRIYNVVDNQLEESLKPSCREAAVRIMIRPEGILIRQEIVEAGSTNAFGCIKVINSDHPRTHEVIWRFLPEIRSFALAIIQDRSYRIDERLTILGMFLKDFQAAAEKSTTDDFGDLLAFKKRQMQSSALRESIGRIPVNLSLQMAMVANLSSWARDGRIADTGLARCFSQFFEGTHYSSGREMPDIAREYAGIFTNYYRPFMTTAEYLLENYLVNAMFGKVFPFTDDTHVDFHREFVSLAVGFSIVRMLLIGMAGYHGGLDADLVVTLVSSFSRTMEHNRALLDSIVDLLHTNNLDTVAHMTMLLKN